MIEAKNISGSIKGHYFIRVFSDAGEERVEKRQFSKNIITHGGAQAFHSIGSNPFYTRFTDIVVGSGTSSIQESSTQLGQELASTGHDVSDVTVNENDDGTATFVCTFSASFDVGTFDNATLSEVGLETRANVLGAGQLIVDENGDPTTVTILSDEQLVVDYTVEATLPTESYVAGSGTVDVKGQSINYEIWAGKYFDDPLDPTGAHIASNGGITGAASIWDSSRSKIFSDWGTADSSTTEDGMSRTFTANMNFSPDSWVSDDIKEVCVGFHHDEAITNNGEQILGIVFDPSLSKDDTEAFSLEFSLTHTVSQG